MIWSVDLDDDVYSALSGLTNKTLGVIETGPEAGEIDGDGKSVSQNWASQNGQQCFQGDCVDEDGPADSCGSGYTRVGKKKCGNKQHENICCPLTGQCLIHP